MKEKENKSPAGSYNDHLIISVPLYFCRPSQLDCSGVPLPHSDCDTFYGFLTLLPNRRTVQLLP